jgi:hypothetical protein
VRFFTRRFLVPAMLLELVGSNTTTMNSFRSMRLLAKLRIVVVMAQRSQFLDAAFGEKAKPSELSEENKVQADTVLKFQAFFSMTALLIVHIIIVPPRNHDNNNRWI